MNTRRHLPVSLLFHALAVFAAYPGNAEQDAADPEAGTTSLQTGSTPFDFFPRDSVRTLANYRSHRHREDDADSDSDSEREHRARPPKARLRIENLTRDRGTLNWIRLDARRSKGRHSGIAHYEYQITKEPGGVAVDGPGAIQDPVAAVLLSPGKYAVSLTVTDNRGASRSQSRRLHIRGTAIPDFDSQGVLWGFGKHWHVGDESIDFDLAIGPIDYQEIRNRFANVDADPAQDTSSPTAALQAQRGCGKVLNTAGLVTKSFTFIPYSGLVLGPVGNGLSFAGGNKASACTQNEIAKINAQLFYQESQIESIQSSMQQLDSQFLAAYTALQWDDVKQDYRDYQTLIDDNLAPTDDDSNFNRFMNDSGLYSDSMPASRCNSMSGTYEGNICNPDKPSSCGVSDNSLCTVALTVYPTCSDTGLSCDFSDDASCDNQPTLCTGGLASVDAYYDDLAGFASSSSAAIMAAVDSVSGSELKQLGCERNCFKSVQKTANTAPSDLLTLYKDLRGALDLNVNDALCKNSISSCTPTNVIPLLDQYNSALAFLYQNSLYALQQAFMMEAIINQFNYFSPPAKKTNPIPQFPGYDGRGYYTPDADVEQGNTDYNDAQLELALTYAGRINQLYLNTLGYIISDVPVQNQAYPLPSPNSPRCANGSDIGKVCGANTAIPQCAGDALCSPLSPIPYASTIGMNVLEAVDRTPLGWVTQEVSGIADSPAVLCAASDYDDCSCDGDVYYGKKYLDSLTANGDAAPGSGTLTTFSEMTSESSYALLSGVTGSVECGPASFEGGDPAFGFYKHCYCVAQPPWTDNSVVYQFAMQDVYACNKTLDAYNAENGAIGTLDQAFADLSDCPAMFSVPGGGAPRNGYYDGLTLQPYSYSVTQKAVAAGSGCDPACSACQSGVGALYACQGGSQDGLSCDPTGVTPCGADGLCIQNMNLLYTCESGADEGMFCDPTDSSSCDNQQSSCRPTPGGIGLVKDTAGGDLCSGFCTSDDPSSSAGFCGDYNYAFAGIANSQNPIDCQACAEETGTPVALGSWSGSCDPSTAVLTSDPLELCAYCATSNTTLELSHSCQPCASGHWGNDDGQLVCEGGTPDMGDVPLLVRSAPMRGNLGGCNSGAPGMTWYSVPSEYSINVASTLSTSTTANKAGLCEGCVALACGNWSALDASSFGQNGANYSSTTWEMPPATAANDQDGTCPEGQTCTVAGNTFGECEAIQWEKESGAYRNSDWFLSAYIGDWRCLYIGHRDTTAPQTQYGYGVSDITLTPQLDESAQSGDYPWGCGALGFNTITNTSGTAGYANLVFEDMNAATGIWSPLRDGDGTSLSTGTYTASGPQIGLQLVAQCTSDCPNESEIGGVSGDSACATLVTPATADTMEEYGYSCEMAVWDAPSPESVYPDVADQQGLECTLNDGREYRIAWRGSRALGPYEGQVNTGYLDFQQTNIGCPEACYACESGVDGETYGGMALASMPDGRSACQGFCSGFNYCGGFCYNQPDGDSPPVDCRSCGSGDPYDVPPATSVGNVLDDNSCFQYGNSTIVIPPSDVNGYTKYYPTEP